MGEAEIDESDDEFYDSCEFMLDENCDRENSIRANNVNRAHVIEPTPVDRSKGSINLNTNNINENIDRQRLLQGLGDYSRGRNMERKTKLVFKGGFRYDLSAVTNKHVT